MCFLNCSQALKHIYDLILHFFSSSCKKACNVRNCKFCIARWLLACQQLIEFVFTAKRSTHEMHFSVLHSLPIFQVRKLGTLKLEVIRQNEDFFREKVVKCVGVSGGGFSTQLSYVKSILKCSPQRSEINSVQLSLYYSQEFQNYPLQIKKIQAVKLRPHTVGY